MGRIARSIAAALLAGHPRRTPGRGATRRTETAALQAIWDVVGMIPKGRVSTYGAVARAAGLPGRARLAGRALKLAPETLHLPWHRVVGAGGRIVFPATSPHFREQCRRLRAERVPVAGGRVKPAHWMDLALP